MEAMVQRDLTRARHLTRLAAQWLHLLRFQVHGSAPIFAPGVSTYHAMLDPKTTDGERLGACQAMLPHVLRQVIIENVAGEAAYADARPIDPYRAHWKTTERGIAVSIIAAQLSEAIKIFRQVVRPQGAQ